MNNNPFKYRKLSYEYDLFFDIKDCEQMRAEVDELVGRLSLIAKLCREDGHPIDEYILRKLGLTNEDHKQAGS